MEEELYQRLAEDVRVEIQSNPRYFPLVLDFTTLRRACQYTGRMVASRLQELGKDVKVLKLLYSYRERGELRQGSHIVALVDGTIIDPSITQFFPEERQYVFPESKYPLPIAMKEPTTVK